jgi:hypothetical protein
VAGVCGGLGVRTLADYFFKELLPFWHELFALLSAIAWPAVFLWIALIFKNQIKALIPRLRKAGTSGLEFGDQQENIGPEPKLTISTDQSENILRPPAVAIVEQPIREDLKNYDETKVVDHLVTALARERLDRVFSLAYANIFGSQIRFLRDIVGLNGSATQTEAQKFFNDLKELDPAFADWELARYLNFLSYFKFIEELDGEIKITDFGREFLIFLARYGLSQDRWH